MTVVWCVCGWTRISMFSFDSFSQTENANFQHPKTKTTFSFNQTWKMFSMPIFNPESVEPHSGQKPLKVFSKLIKYWFKSFCFLSCQTFRTKKALKWIFHEVKICCHTKSQNLLAARSLNWMFFWWLEILSFVVLVDTSFSLLGEWCQNKKSWKREFYFQGGKFIWQLLSREKFMISSN